MSSLNARILIQDPLVVPTRSQIGTLLSIPVPAAMPSLMSRIDHLAPLSDPVGEIAQGKDSLDSKCHLDPGLEWMEKTQQAGWCGSLRRATAAQGQLNRYAVGNGLNAANNLLLQTSDSQRNSALLKYLLV